MIDSLLLAYLQGRKKIGLKGVDVERPLQLLQEYQEQYGSPTKLQPFLTHLLGHPSQVDILESTPYLELKATLEEKATIFQNRPYQLGALDTEIDFIVALLSNMPQPHVLEIGVANGYSSACIYAALAMRQEIDKQFGRLVSIDLPRFSSVLKGRAALVRKRLAEKGLIKNTGTLGDLNPGGIVPVDKYAGWLVPMSHRLQIPNVTLYGNAFHILAEMPADTRFDLIIIDAMKRYQARFDMLEIVFKHLNPSGFCILDGSWINSAMTDFAKTYQYPVYQLGRIGVCQKKDTV